MKGLLFLIICFLLLGFLSLGSLPLLAQDSLALDLAIGEELDDEMEMDFEIEVDTETASKGVSPFRFTLDHGVTYRIGSTPNLINNRSGFEIEYSQSIAEGTFVLVDLLANLYWPNDHIPLEKTGSMEAEGFIREAWLQQSYESITFKLGYQNIVWNEVEGSLATDLINPTDSREMLFVDFEEARIPQMMLSFQIYGEGITWEGFINPLPLYNKNPSLTSIYHIVTPLDAFPILASNPTEPEAGLRGQFKIGKSEVALMLARLLPNQPNYAQAGPNLQEVVTPFWMVGASFNYPAGNTLWKGDIGYKTKQGINDQTFALLERNVVDLAFGVEHSIHEHQLSASITYSNILHWDASLALPEATSFYILGWSKSYLLEDLSLNAGLMGVVSKPVMIFSLIGSYKFDDELSLQSSLYLFQIKDSLSPFYPFRNEHRAALKISYKL